MKNGETVIVVQDMDPQCSSFDRHTVFAATLVDVKDGEAVIDYLGREFTTNLDRVFGDAGTAVDSIIQKERFNVQVAESDLKYAKEEVARWEKRLRIADSPVWTPRVCIRPGCSSTLVPVGEALICEKCEFRYPDARLLTHNPQEA